jgi:hypothetical protein
MFDQKTNCLSHNLFGASLQDVVSTINRLELKARDPGQVLTLPKWNRRIISPMHEQDRNINFFGFLEKVD